MAATKRLFSHTFEELDRSHWCVWCTIKHSVKRRRIEPAAGSPNESENVSRYIGNKEYTITSRPPTREIPIDSVPVSEEFLNALKEVLEHDHAVRYVSRLVEKRQQAYLDILEDRAKKCGQLERLRRNGIFGFQHEQELKGLDPKPQRKVLKNTVEKMPKLERARRRAFVKLYGIAQNGIDSIDLRDKTVPHHFLPKRFFEELQALLDLRQDNQDHSQKTRQLRAQVTKHHQDSKASQPADESTASIKSRRDALNEYHEAKQEADAREQNQRTGEDALITIAWPFVATEPGIFHRLPQKDNVPRGKDYEPMTDNLSEQAEAMPSNRDRFIDATKRATDLASAKAERYKGLEETYARDLEKYLKDKGHSQQNREEFDAQYFKDRAQAIDEYAQVKRYQARLKERRADEGLRKLADMDENYPQHIHGDGYAGSMDT